MKFDDFDRQMRVYEQSIDQIVPSDKTLIARLDGRGFTRLTKEVCQFEAPFDERFRDMMVATVKALMTDGGMKISYGYTESDEMSLLFAPEADAFGRKVRKLNSILAGMASAEFSLRLGRMAVFDCRIVPLPSNDLIVDYFRWRMEDAHRNALNSWCYWTLRKAGATANEASRRLVGKSQAFKLEFLLQNGIIFDELPAWQKNGVALYWKQETKEGFNPITKQQAFALRNRLVVDMELKPAEAAQQALS